MNLLNKTDPKTRITVETTYHDGLQDRVTVERNTSELSADDLLRTFASTIIVLGYAPEGVDTAILDLAYEIETKNKVDTDTSDL